MQDNRRYSQRLANLKTERASFDSQYMDIARVLLPRAGRFFPQDRNRGDNRHNEIYDSTGTYCLRVLGAGMMSGGSSPARPWIKFGLADKDLEKNHSVQKWLFDVSGIVLRIFGKSNAYRLLQSIYEELPAFGTSGGLVFPNFDNVIHGQFLTTGEYYIAQNSLSQVDTVFREFDMTVGQIIHQFGYENASHAVKQLYDRGNIDAWTTVVHCIEPRYACDPKDKSNKGYPFKEIYFERGRENDQLLFEGGHKIFRGIFPRWHVSGGDVYGTSCPGMESLGDLRQLQHEQIRKAEGIDYMIRPPVQVPSTLKNKESEMFPGGLNFVDAASASGQMRSVYEVRIDLSHLLADINDVRNRLQNNFFTPLFLMAAQDNGTMTAFEVAKKQEEKLLMLGPVYERVKTELYMPLIDIAFHDALEAGILPAPPPELQGMDLAVEFISLFSQAQKAAGVNSIDRYIGTIGSISKIKPGILDKLNEDSLADVYADAMGIDPSLINASEQVALIRKKQAQMQQQAQSAAMMNQQADTAQKLANANTGEKNALTDVMQQLQGY